MKLSVNLFKNVLSKVNAKPKCVEPLVLRLSQAFFNCKILTLCTGCHNSPTLKCFLLGDPLCCLPEIWQLSRLDLPKLLTVFKSFRTLPRSRMDHAGLTFDILTTIHVVAKRQVIFWLRAFHTFCSNILDSGMVQCNIESYVRWQCSCSRRCRHHWDHSKSRSLYAHCSYGIASNWYRLWNFFVAIWLLGSATTYFWAPFSSQVLHQIHLWMKNDRAWRGIRHQFLDVVYRYKRMLLY